MKTLLLPPKQKPDCGESSLTEIESQRTQFSFEVYSRINFPVKKKSKVLRSSSGTSGKGNPLNMGNFFVQNDHIPSLQTKQKDFSKKISVRIDHKTFILVDPGTTAEKARFLYSEFLKSKMNE
jgi:hypothetical protein